MGFSRQEYWSGLPVPSPGNLPDPGNEQGSPALQADWEAEVPNQTAKIVKLLKSFPEQFIQVHRFRFQIVW